jgi:hypothetical protein
MEELFVSIADTGLLIQALVQLLQGGFTDTNFRMLSEHQSDLQTVVSLWRLRTFNPINRDVLVSCPAAWRNDPTRCANLPKRALRSNVGPYCQDSKVYSIQQPSAPLLDEQRSSLTESSLSKI